MQTTPTIEKDETLNEGDAAESPSQPNSQTGSGPVSQLYDVERRLSRIYSVVHSVTALASHENEPPPTIYLTEALELLDEQLGAALDEVSEALTQMRSEALTDQEDTLNGVKAAVGNTEDGQ